MSNEEVRWRVNLGTSCTQDEAVIKLLGWHRGPIAEKVSEIPPLGMPEGMDDCIPQRGQSLEEYLFLVRATLRGMIMEETDGRGSAKVLRGLQEDLDRFDALISRAHQFSLDITEELCKSDLSELILDETASKDRGVPCIAWRSLDRWSMKKYGIRTLESSSSPSIGLSETISVDVTLNEASEKSQETSDNDSLLITFAFLLEEYAKKHKTTLLHPDGRVNAYALSKELVEIINAVTKNPPPRGQGAESIRKRIDLALKTKDQKLRSR